MKVFQTQTDSTKYQIAHPSPCYTETAARLTYALSLHMLSPDPIGDAWVSPEVSPPYPDLPEGDFYSNDASNLITGAAR